MWKVLKRVINRKSKCNLVDKITVNNTEITNKQEISDEMNEYFASIGSNLAEGIWGSWWYLNLQGDTQGHVGNSEISEFFGRKISNAILPFSCNFNHNSPGAKYFEAKRVQTVWAIWFILGKNERIWIKNQVAQTDSELNILLIKYCKERW